MSEFLTLEAFVDLLTGDLSPAVRIWTAMAPALAISAYFIVGLLIYVVRYALRGSYRDPEMESRGSSFLINQWLRLYFAWLIQPLWKLVVRSGIPPNAITTLSALMALASGISLAAGRFALGGWLYIFSGTLDVIDGRLARARKMSSASGAALDSILDRYADSAVLCGLAWYYRESWVLLPVLLALVGSALVPYIRARGEAGGVSIKIGLMQRAERIMYLGVACAISPILEVVLVPEDPRPLHRIAIAGVVLLAVATQLTALRRLIYLLSALSDRPRSWLRANGRPVVRNILTASAATSVDFIALTLLVSLASVSPPAATGVGCVIGGVVSFTVNRAWTYGSVGAKLPQIRRYIFVSFTSALLNSGGVAVLLLLPDVDYRIAWVLVRVAVFTAWNFPLHRDYVFGQSTSVVPQTETVQPQAPKKERPHRRDDLSIHNERDVFSDSRDLAQRSLGVRN